MLKLFLFLLALTCSLSLSAHYTYRGKVVDATTQQPLEGATILAEGFPAGATSNELGQFTLRADTLIQAIIVSYLGYESQRVEIKDAEGPILVEMKPTLLDLEQVTVSGTQEALRVLTGVDVRLRPVNSSQEILRSVPGLIIAQHAGGGKAEQIFLRGFDIDHGTDVAISVDGLPVNMVSHAHGQGYADLHFLIPELINRVEYGKGPYHTGYGNFTTAGFVNFTTPDAVDQSLVKWEGGRFNTLRGLAVADLLGKDARKRGQFAYAAAEYLLTDGPFESPQNFNRLNLFGKYTYRMDNGAMLRVLASTLRSKWDASGQIPERAVARGLINRFGAIDDTEGGSTSRTNLSVQLQRDLPGDAFLQQQLYYSDYDFELYSNFTFFLNDPVNGDQIRQREDRRIYGYRGLYEKPVELGPFAFQTAVGWGFRYDEVRDNELSRTRNREETILPLSLGDIDELNGWMYLDEKIRFSKRWLLNLGLRMDFFRFEYVDQLQVRHQTLSDQKLFLGPKFNLVYDWSPNVQWFLKTGIGYHSNDTRVVVRQEGKAILPAAYGADLGLNWKPVPRLLIHLAGWYLGLEQEFVYVGDEAIVEPSGRTRRLGLDGSVRYQVNDWLFADADLNYAFSRSIDDPEGENFIPLAPRLTSAGGLTARRDQGFNGSLRYRYVQDRPANPSGSVTAKGYFLVEAALNFTRPGYELGLSMDNLLNSDWNEAQFDTESRLFNEPEPVSELHFTPGVPFFWKLSCSIFLGN